MDEKSKEVTFVQNELMDIRNKLILMVDQWHSEANKRFLKFLQDELKVRIQKELDRERSLRPAFVPNVEVDDKFLLESIDALGLHIRTENCLLSENINTIQQLIETPALELFKIPNLGRKSLRDIKDCLADKGLELKYNNF
jgi:DNA-directed RNA polymerase alpha subunit